MNLRISPPCPQATAPYLDDRRYEIILDDCRRFRAGQPLRNLVDKARWFWPPSLRPGRKSIRRRKPAA
jgi:hypothetical protein